MTRMNFSNRATRLGVSTLAVLALFSAGYVSGLAGPRLVTAAWAQGHEDGEGHEGGGQGPKGPGGTGGHEGGGGHEEDGHEGGEHEGAGSGGPGKGGQGGQGQGGQGGGGRPPWAQEGIPDVELGRLNVARSPTHVLDRAYAEALSGFNAGKAEFYNMTIDEAVAKLSAEFQTMDIIDSPLQNLALFRDALDGTSVLNDLPNVSNDVDTLKAIFLGVASDKNIPITTDTVLALTIIMGQPMSEAEAAILAQNAEKIRIAVLAGHG